MLRIKKAKRLGTDENINFTREVSKIALDLPLRILKRPFSCQEYKKSEYGFSSQFLLSFSSFLIRNPHTKLPVDILVSEWNAFPYIWLLLSNSIIAYVIEHCKTEDEIGERASHTHTRTRHYCLQFWDEEEKKKISKNVRKHQKQQQ